MTDGELALAILRKFLTDEGGWSDVQNGWAQIDGDVSLTAEETDLMRRLSATDESSRVRSPQA